MCVRALLVRSTLDSQKKRGKTQKQVEGRKPHTQKKKSTRNSNINKGKIEVRYLFTCFVLFYYYLFLMETTGVKGYFFFLDF